MLTKMKKRYSPPKVVVIRSTRPSTPQCSGVNHADFSIDGPSDNSTVAGWKLPVTWTDFDAAKGDVRLSGQPGAKLRIVASY